MAPAKTPSLELCETLRQRKAQYCRAADTHDWSSFASLLHPTITAQFTDPTGAVVTENGVTYSFANRDEFVSFFQKAFETQQTIHIVGPGEFEFTTADDENEVRAVWSVVYHAASLGVQGGWTGTGGGRYHEVWKKIDGEWVIASLRMERGFWKVQTL
ncbi:hypothetical protein BJY04DRAFT_61495 [Aspergillus karnatakaensis]|uniref:uncharacterized protein n=1 Tax=Aspergillus karnatakaensis TaxID=1810916 RepID=UPI003CCDBDB1